MSRTEELELRNRLLIGLNVSYTRLIEKKQKEDGNLIFSENGKIVKIKARKLNQGTAPAPRQTRIKAAI